MKHYVNEIHTGPFLERQACSLCSINAMFDEFDCFVFNFCWLGSWIVSLGLPFPCSGILVSDRHLLAASECIRTSRDGLKFKFNFSNSSSEEFFVESRKDIESLSVLTINRALNFSQPGFPIRFHKHKYKI